MMTERAQQIVDQKPTGWEYKLTAELLEAELRPIRTRFEDIDRGVAFAPTKTVDGLEFMQFVQEQSRKLQVMLQQPELILQNELMPDGDWPRRWRCCCDRACSCKIRRYLLAVVRVGARPTSGDPAGRFRTCPPKHEGVGRAPLPGGGRHHFEALPDACRPAKQRSVCFRDGFQSTRQRR